MTKKISYRAVPIERLTSVLLAAMLTGATKLVVAIDVAKLKMMAGFGPEDGTVARLVRFESPAQTGRSSSSSSRRARRSACRSRR